MDSAGNVYVMDSGNNRVEEFNASGTLLLNMWTVTGGGYCTGIGVDSNNNVWISDEPNQKIYKFSNTGTLLCAFSSITGVGSASYYDPSGLTIDSNGNIYVSLPELGVIEEYSSCAVASSQPAPSLKSSNSQGNTGFGTNSTPTATMTPTCSPTVTPTQEIASSGPPVLYPNPWTGTSPEKLHVYLKYATRLEVKIYDLSYRKVQDAVLTQVLAGWNDITLPMEDTSGQSLPDGLYYVSVSTNWGRTINKLLILK